MSYCANGGWRAGKAGRDRRSACSVAWGSDLWTLKLSPGWAGGCRATACVSVLQGKPRRRGWCGDATSGLLGRRSALFKHALHAVIVRRVAGAQWGERGAAMGYGLWALRLCGSAALGALAPWRRGGAVCLSFGSCVYQARGADATRAVYVQTRQRLTGRPRNETRAHHHQGRVAYLTLSGYRIVN